MVRDAVWQYWAVMLGLLLRCPAPMAEQHSSGGFVSNVVAYRKQTVLESKYLSAWKSLSERQPEGFGV